ncbi:MAG: hypothetical protein JW902_11295 [Syntrophaceae bacterium]|nr:hypothetical protein [Syntrophaceae bacterium]
MDVAKNADQILERSDILAFAFIIVLPFKIPGSRGRLLVRPMAIVPK